MANIVILGNLAFDSVSLINLETDEPLTFDQKKVTKWVNFVFARLAGFFVWEDKKLILIDNTGKMLKKVDLVSLLSDQVLTTDEGIYYKNMETFIRFNSQPLGAFLWENMDFIWTKSFIWNLTQNKLFIDLDKILEVLKNKEIKLGDGFKKKITLVCEEEVYLGDFSVNLQTLQEEEKVKRQRKTVECIICFNETEKQMLYPCAHKNICPSCHVSLTKRECPICRHPFNLDEVEDIDIL